MIPETFGAYRTFLHYHAHHKLSFSNLVWRLLDHHIQNVADTSDQLLVNLSLAPTFFQEEMAYLKTNHYETLTLDEMSDTPLNKKVALTFDDGYIDIYQNAYPMMEKLGFQGTVFAITDLVGTPGYMNWDNLKTLQKAGWSIESHTVSHPDLANLSNDQANYQIVESKKIIEKELGAKVNFFCYPSGKYNNETVVLLKAAGYKGAVTTQYGTENSVYNLFELQRIRINGGTSLNSFTSPL